MAGEFEIPADKISEMTPSSGGSLQAQLRAKMARKATGIIL